MFESVQHLNGYRVGGMHSSLLKVASCFAMAHRVPPLDLHVSQFVELMKRSRLDSSSYGARQKDLRSIAHTVVMVTCQTHNSRAFDIGRPTGSFPWSLRVWFSIACAACVRRLPCLSLNSLTRSL